MQVVGSDLVARGASKAGEVGCCVDGFVTRVGSHVKLSARGKPNNVQMNEYFIKIL